MSDEEFLLEFLEAAIPDERYLCNWCLGIHPEDDRIRVGGGWRMGICSRCDDRGPVILDNQTGVYDDDDEEEI